MFVVEQAGTHPVSSAQARRSWTSRPRRRPAASRACCRWPSRPTTRRAGCSTSTTPTRTATSRSSSTRRRATTADPASARQVLLMADDEGNHNGGQLQFGPDELLYIGTGDGGGGGDQHGARGNGQNLGIAARQDPAHRPQGRAATPYTIPSDNPFVGQAGARGGDLRLRPAQPVAVLVRPRDRRPVDRRRRPGRVGGDQLRRARQGRGRELRLARRSRATTRYADGESAPGHVKPVIDAVARRRQLLDHRRRT